MSTYNRAATEAALVEAVGELLAERGFEGLGVNAIARQAGVNKALIYRYFDGIDGLYRAFAATHALWPSIEELLGDIPERAGEMTFQEVFVELFGLYAAALRARPRTIELLAWECVTRNELTRAFEEVRERRSHEVIAQLSTLGLEPRDDLEAAVAMVSSSIHYLAIRSRQIRVYAGVQISSDAFWEEELPRAVGALARGLA